MALVLATGCLIGAARREEQLASTTHLTALHLGSRTPPLPVFVVRIAQSELPLSNEQAKSIGALSTDADATTQPIDDARIVFLELLAQSVEQGSFATTPVKTAADRLVRATEQATPQLVAQVEDLHRTLTPAQRRILVQIVTTKFDAWAPLWDAAEWEPKSEPNRYTARPLEGAARQWIMAFRDEDTRALGTAITLDTTTRARQWTADLGRRIEMDLPKLDPTQRRALIIRLRTDGFANVPSGRQQQQPQQQQQR
jgi:hypothetical protein